jgi:hypothetical protein
VERTERQGRAVAEVVSFLFSARIWRSFSGGFELLVSEKWRGQGMCHRISRLYGIIVIISTRVKSILLDLFLSLEEISCISWTLFFSLRKQHKRYRFII